MHAPCTQAYAWRTVGHATMSLLHLVLGVADPFALRETNWVLGPLLYAVFLFLFYLILAPFFLAIVQALRPLGMLHPLACYAHLTMLHPLGMLRPLGMLQPHVSRPLSQESYAIEARCIDRNVESGLVVRQAARRQMAALLRPCGRRGLQAAEWLLPTALEEEVEAERAQSRVVEEVHLERAMDGVKEGVMVGHLHTVSEVNTQLKAMCFRQDSMALPLREPLQVRLAASALSLIHI